MSPIVSSDPYISINKLAEYIQAKSTRRRQIIKNLKEDKEFYKLYYSQVRNALIPYFNSGYNHARIDPVIKRIEKRKGTTAWDDKDNPNSVLALKCLKNAVLPDLSDYDIVTDIDKLDNMVLGGLKVIIKPEIYLRHRATDKIGAIKIHIAKTPTSRLNQAGRECAATIIKCGFMDMGYKESEIDNKGCISIDVFEEQFNTAPRAFKRTLAELTCACEEIVDRWPSL